MEIYVYYKVSVQPADNPDKPNMFHMMRFPSAAEALAWVNKNSPQLHEVYFTKPVRLSVIVEDAS